MSKYVVVISNETMDAEVESRIMPFADAVELYERLIGEPTLNPVAGLSFGPAYVRDIQGGTISGLSIKIDPVE